MIVDILATIGLCIMIIMLGYNFIEDAGELDTVEISTYFGVVTVMVLSLLAIWN